MTSCRLPLQMTSAIKITFAVPSKAQALRRLCLENTGNDNDYLHTVLKKLLMNFLNSILTFNALRIK